METTSGSALNEREGVAQPQSISGRVNDLLRKRRQPTPDELLRGIFAGDISALSRAITLIESRNAGHQQQAAEIIQACLPKSGNSVRIGITGVPGVGKSTFIEAFGTFLTGLGKKVAVLAVDPSSSISHGSILGDKTRMEELVKDPNAYIRPSASGDTLGGVAAKTRETITLCEAFGFEVIIIETVGVGQSETAVHGMVDFFLLLKIAGAGDELQGIKRGIMEMADAIVINKADGDNIKKAGLARVEFVRALHLFPPKESGWTPTVTTCSATEKTGIRDVWETIGKFIEKTTASGYFEEQRAKQDIAWFRQTIDQSIRSHFYGDPSTSAKVEQLAALIKSRQISPFAAAEELLNDYFGKRNQDS